MNFDAFSLACDCSVDPYKSYDCTVKVIKDNCRHGHAIILPGQDGTNHICC